MVYVFLAEGFEEVEALAPVDILRRAGVEVQLVGVGGKTVTGSHRITVQCDLMETELPTELPQGVILPGGLPGTTHLEENNTVQALVARCAKEGKIIGALCAAPSILGHMGLLEGREATVYPTFQSALAGAKLSEAYVCRDGQFITGRGMGVSIPFGLKLAEAFAGKEVAGEIARSIQMEHPPQ